MKEGRQEEGREEGKERKRQVIRIVHVSMQQGLEATVEYSSDDNVERVLTQLVVDESQ